MNELTVFQNQEFGRMRTTEIDGEVWFVGKDVARALGYKNPQEAIRYHVDAEDKGVSAEQMVEIAQRMAAAMGAEIVKQLKYVLAPSTPCVQEEVVLMDPVPRRRQRYHSVITMLDPELQREVDEMLESNRYTYMDIVQFLKENGVGISVSSICRYAKRYFYNR